MIKQIKLYATKGCILIALLASALPSYAETVCKPTIRTFFGNGVWNSEEDARKSLLKIVNGYAAPLKEKHPESEFVYEIAYNHKQGLVADIVETLRQKALETPGVLEGTGITAEQYVNYYIGGGFDDVYENWGGGFNDKSEDELNEAMMIEQAKQVLEGSQLIEDLNTHIKQYKTRLDAGEAVIVIAHSQGNLFANSALEALVSDPEYDPQRLAMIGVGSAAGKVVQGLYSIGNYEWFTDINDAVIAALLLPNLIPEVEWKVLPRYNFNNWKSKLTFNHTFAGAYFKEGLNTRQLIDDQFFAYVTELEDTLTENPEQLTCAVRQPIEVHAGISQIAMSTTTDGVYESSPSGFNKILASDKSVKNISKSYNTDHYFILLNNGVALGRGDNQFNQINHVDTNGNYVSTYDGSGGNHFGSIGPYYARTTSNAYSCYYIKNTIGNSWQTITTYEKGSVGLSADGSDAYGWGDNTNLHFGRGMLLFNNPLNDPSISCPLSSGSLSFYGFTQLSAGHAHVLGLTKDGQVYSWGKDEAALGRVKSKAELLPKSLLHAQPIKLFQRPAQITLLSEPQIDIEAGNGFSVVLSEEGVVRTFGTDPNGIGVLGRKAGPMIGAVTFRDDYLDTPDNLDDDYVAHKIIAISAGVNNAMAIDNLGYVWVWGETFGELGSTQTHHAPVRVREKPIDDKAPIKYFVANSPAGVNVHAGPNYQLIQVGNQLYGWGDNFNGVMGNLIPTSGADYPTLIFSAE